MVPGDELDAVVLSRPQDWPLAWDRQLNPSGIVIVQNLDLEGDAKVRFQVGMIKRFLATQFHRQPSLMYVDEGHDFYGPTGNAKFGTAIQECFRAGAEQGMSSLFGVQRPKTINMQILTESNICYLFHMKFTGDLKRLLEMGMEVDETPEEGSHRFRFFRGGRLHPKELKLRKPERKAA